MSVYSTGAEAYRDTTKWLVAFVPIASLLAAGAATGPRLVSHAAASDSLGQWASDETWALVGIVTIAAGIGLVILWGARVLSTQPENFDKLLDEPRSDLDTAFSAGVGLPYFLTSTPYATVVLGLTADRNKSPGTADKVTESAAAQAVATTETLREWALQDQLSHKFKGFQICFGLGVILILVGLLLAASTVTPVGGAIDEPKPVEIGMESAGAAALLSATGCTDPTQTTFLAVGGTWDAPVLEADGPGCRFRARWRPHPHLIEIRLPTNS